MQCRVRFRASSHPPVSLPRHSNLSEHLTVQNSPVLFGCRTGICGTCVVHVDGDIPPPNDEELDTLETVAPGDPRARLACQLDLTADIDIAVA
jgi:ferredoxin